MRAGDHANKLFGGTAEAFGETRGTLSSIERGRRNISLVNIHALAARWAA
jgi:hypothetical protein